MTEAPLSTLQRPCLAHQILINLAGFLTAQMIEDQRWPLALDAMADAVARCPVLPADDAGAVPMLETLRRAAEIVIHAAPNRRQPAHSMDWAVAISGLRAVVSEILWARGCMAQSAFAEQAREPADA